jgi:hypothetical protein
MTLLAETFLSMQQIVSAGHSAGVTGIYELFKKKSKVKLSP